MPGASTDFDESYPLPYTNDLVRLAASVKTVIDGETLTIKLKNGCEAILEGYQKTLKAGGCPIVLAEREKNLERLGIKALKPSDDFWETLNRLPAMGDAVPGDADKALKANLPDAHLKYKVVRREAGMGSLGQQRFVAIAQWNGGFIGARGQSDDPLVLPVDSGSDRPSPILLSGPALFRRAFTGYFSENRRRVADSQALS